MEQLKFSSMKPDCSLKEKEMSLICWSPPPPKKYSGIKQFLSAKKTGRENIEGEGGGQWP